MSSEPRPGLLKQRPEPTAQPSVTLRPAAATKETRSKASTTGTKTRRASSPKAKKRLAVVTSAKQRDWSVFRRSITAARTARRAPMSDKRTKLLAKAPQKTISDLGTAAAAGVELSATELSEIRVGESLLRDRLPERDEVVLKAPAYYLDNRQMFVSFINTLLAPYLDKLREEAQSEVSCDTRGSGGKWEMMTAQAIIRDYINVFTPYRGLLVYHGLGAGKTCASIAIAEGLKHALPALVMTPASLRRNYLEELKMCGDPLFRRNQHWEFVRCGNDPKLCTAMADVLSLEPATIREAGGAWLVDATKPPNIADLSPENRASLDGQINRMIQTRYQFLNYNGIRIEHYNAMTEDGSKNPFDGRVVIVDEVHNLVSRIVNKMGDDDALASRIYKDLITAKGARLVFLTGTPIINYPNELGVLFNMLRGVMRVYELPVAPIGAAKVGAADVKKALKAVPQVDIAGYQPSTRTVTVQRNPHGFAAHYRRNRYSGVNKTEAGDEDDATFLRQVERALRDIGLRSDWGSRVQFTDFRAFPDTLEAFNAHFIDPVTGEVLNRRMLSRRMLGLASYFRSPSEQLMPDYDPAKDLKVERLPMSDYQFGLYEIERAAERKREGKGRSAGAGKGSGSGVYKESTSTYRIFSRAFCNFVFPVGIPRPKPSDVDEPAGGEPLEETVLDAATLELRGQAGSPLTPTERRDLSDYDTRIEEAMLALEAKAAEYLSPRGLATYSPKFLRLLENINALPNACHLIYSQFRTIEGIGVIRLVLLANGFVEFKVEQKDGVWRLAVPARDRTKPMFVLYTGTEGFEEKEIARNAFNGSWDKLPDGLAAELAAISPNNNYGQIMRVFMITAAGAEGITLKNVRRVHLVEPYWHPVRTEQVIGRAMRLCSHEALPRKDRTVDVVLYLMTFSAKQRTEATKEMLQSDKSRVNPTRIVTSDEALYEISEVKAKVNRGLLSAIKEAAIDCAIYAGQSKENLQCVAFPGTDPKRLSYTADISAEDTAQTEASNVREQRWSATEVTISGKKYALRDGKGARQLYDLQSFVDYQRGLASEPMLVGVLVLSKDGKATIKLPWEV
jgi:hypothetical protein